jgi:hypothetical protein
MKMVSMFFRSLNSPFRNEKFRGKNSGFSTAQRIPFSDSPIETLTHASDVPLSNKLFLLDVTLLLFLDILSLSDKIFSFSKLSKFS